ncbi:AMP-binding protein [soil metagenome]
MTTTTDEPSWVFDQTVGSVLRRAAAEYGDRDALVFPALGLRWSWKNLDRRVDAVASALIERGVGPGEHVGIWAMNGPEWIVSQYAVGRMGSVLVNINPAYRLQELEEALRKADVVTLIVGLPFKTSNYVEMVQELCPEVVNAAQGTWRSARLPELRRLVAIGDRPGPGWLAWSDLETGRPGPTLADREAAVFPDDIDNIQFTSGTTGLPKGAMLTHRNMLTNAYHVGQRTRYTSADRVCVPVPFYHCFGCVLGSLVCVLYGSAMVVPAPSFEPSATLQAIETERCTAIYGVPTMFSAMLNHPDRPVRDLSTLRTGIMAGSPCPLPLMRRVMEDLGANEITIGYGQTEASPIITQTSVDDPIEVRSGTVGRPIPGVSVRLIDPLTGQESALDAAGELCARGHNVMAGYYQDPAATARAIDPEGWLHTGDLARRDGENYRIVGRSKELIIRGGENIYPPEIEEYLHKHPGVAEVAVVGLPDLHYGEVVSAWIVPRTGVTVTPEEILEFCRDRIAHFKVPRYVEIVDTLPKTVTGKIRKHVIRDQGIDRFGLSDAGSVPTA